MSEPSATPRPSISVPAQIQGMWQAEISGTTASDGLWQMRVTPADILVHNPKANDPNDYFSLGPVAIDAMSVMFEAQADCPDQATVTTGEYRWQLTGNALAFTLISDSCGDRAGILTKTPWTKVP